MDGFAGVLESFASSLKILQESRDLWIIACLEASTLLLHFGLVQLLQTLLLVLLDRGYILLHVVFVGKESGGCDLCIHATTEIKTLSIVQGLQLLNTITRVVE